MFNMKGKEVTFSVMVDGYLFEAGLGEKAANFLSDLLVMTFGDNSVTIIQER